MSAGFNGDWSLITLRAEAYARSRPRYPLEIMAVVRAILGNYGKRIADIASGTGLLSELLLKIGHEIIAVEPNDHMRTIAERQLFGHSLFTSVGATAEKTTLPSHSVDLIAVGQALHWFDIERAKAEFCRILRQPPIAVVIYNHRKIADDVFHQDLEKTLLHFCPKYRETRHVPGRFDNLLNTFFENGVHSRLMVNNHQTLDSAGLVNRFSSTSFSPRPNDPDFSGFASELRRLHLNHASSGKITLNYSTGIYWGIVGQG